MAVGSKITAANYNALQSRVETILGIGSQGTGFGQEVQSSSVAINDVVTAQHMNLLKQDIDSIHIHLYGSNSGLKSISTSETIGWDQISGDIAKGFQAYYNLVTDLEGDVGIVVDPGQVSLEVALQNTRYSEWNGEVTHQFSVTWSNEDQRRAFFNAGGAIIFEATIEGDTTPKGNDWNTMMANMGKVFFLANTTSLSEGRVPSPSNSPKPIGNYTLTPAWQEIYYKEGQADYYSENYISIEARELFDNQIQFAVKFRDTDQGDPNVDELVRGTLRSIISQRRPTGAGVAVDSPSYSTQTNLSSGS